MKVPKHEEAKRLNAIVQTAPEKCMVLVTAENAHHFKTVPQDGRTYIVQDPRRPWVHHVGIEFQRRRLDVQQYALDAYDRLGVDLTKFVNQAKDVPACHVNQRGKQSRPCGLSVGVNEMDDWVIAVLNVDGPGSRTPWLGQNGRLIDSLLTTNKYM